MKNYYLFILIPFFTYLILNLRNSICKKLNLIEYSNNKTFHKKDALIFGGVFIFTGFLFNFFYLIFYDENCLKYFNYVLVFFIFCTALVDDIIKLTPLQKSASISIIFFVVLFFDETMRITSLNSYYFGFLYFSDSKYISFFLPIIFCILFINAFNFIDGINGLAAAVGLSIILYIFLKNDSLIACFFIITIYISIFLYLNLNKNVFLGDAGNYLISILISILLIKQNHFTPRQYLSEEIFLLLSVPGIDMIRLFFFRIKNKKNPFLGDLNHFHHLLIKKFYLQKSLLIYLMLVNIPIYMFYFLNLDLFFLIFIQIVIYSFLIKKLS